MTVKYTITKPISKKLTITEQTWGKKLTITELICKKLTFARARFIKTHQAEFHDNPTHGLVVDITSQTDGHVILFVENTENINSLLSKLFLRIPCLVYTNIPENPYPPGIKSRQQKLMKPQHKAL